MRTLSAGLLGPEPSNLAIMYRRIFATGVGGRQTSGHGLMAEDIKSAMGAVPLRSTNVRRVVIFGTQGVARELHQLIKVLERTGLPIKCEGFLVDKQYQECSAVHGLPVFGDAGWLVDRPEFCVVIGIGATPPRYRIAKEIERYLGQFVTPIHPQAWIGDTVTVEAGSFVAAQAVATSEISVGKHSQLHVGCTIGHDTKISDFVTIAPGARVSGRVEIGLGTFVGTGAIILPDTKIGCWSIIGAGAVVTRDVEDDVTVAGVPARVIARRKPGWHLVER